MHFRYGVTYTAVLAAGFLAAGTPVCAQDTDDQRANSLHPGSWSLQFEIDNDFVLKPFNNLMLSIKRHTSRHSAFRLGFDLTVDFDDNTETETTVTADTLLVTRDRTTTRNVQSVFVDFVYLNYPRPGRNVNLYWGVGPRIGFSRTTLEAAFTDTAPAGTNVSRTDTLNRNWSAGATGLAGVEWFLSRNFSFHAEYRSWALYSDGTTEYTAVNSSTSNMTTRKGDSNGWAVNGVSVTLGLSVYL